ARLKDQPALPLIWKQMQKDWRATFVCHHALIDPATIGDALEDSPAALEDFWRKALELHAAVCAKTLHQGLLAASLLLTTPHLQPRLIARKLDEADIKEIVRWLERIIASMN